MGKGLLAETKGEADAPRDLREVMNIRQASQYLGISPDTLYKYLSESKIPAFKLGNRWRFKKTTLDRWMDHQSQGGEGGDRKKAISPGPDFSRVGR